MRPTIQVVDAAGSAARDSAAIAAGTPSRALMQRAGAAAAAEIGLRFAERLSRGVVVAAGTGNNGGDGWTVAATLHAAGVAVRVVSCGEPRTDDARAERDAAVRAGVPSCSDVASIDTRGERIAVDALLGTGFRAGTPLRGAVADAVAALKRIGARGDAVIALDLPSGLDASTGAHEGAPRSELTLTFGTVKRGQLVARELCGAIVALDIGLGAHALLSDGATLASDKWFHASLPTIEAAAHKGTRKKIVVLGGAQGMAGAAMLAARGAVRSGAGMVKCVVARESLLPIQEGEPSALAAPWPDDDASFESSIGSWADAVLVGPGLGRSRARELTERVLRLWRGPVVLDADALNAFEGEAEVLAPLLAGRDALVTPHPAEFARLAGRDLADVLAERFTLPAELAGRIGAAVLLKGVPTVVAGRDASVTVVAEGTPILATGGAGDILGGIAVTLLAQTGDAALAGSLAAFAHGRAAYAVSARQVRGYALDDVLHALPAVWGLTPPMGRPPVLVELPAVGERA